MKDGLLAFVLLVSTAAWAGPQANPGDAKAHLDRGAALYEKGDLDGAIGEYREAIRLKPDDADAHFHLGVALRANSLLKPAPGSLGSVIPERRQMPRVAELYKEVFAISLCRTGQPSRMVLQLHLHAGRPSQGNI